METRKDLLGLFREVARLTEEQLSKRFGLSQEDIESWSLTGDLPANFNEVIEANKNQTRKYLVVAESLYLELSTLTALRKAALEDEQYFRNRDIGRSTVYGNQQRVIDHAPITAKLLHELRTRGFGKSIRLQSADSEHEIIYRIAQANYGYPTIGVINRLAPVSSMLVSVEPGDEVRLPRRGRYNVVQVVHLEPKAIQFGQDDDFSSANIKNESWEDLYIQEARRSLLKIVDHIIDALGESSSLGFDYHDQLNERETRTSDEAHLSAQFYTRTTKAQEELLLADPYGLVVVHGVAGSGKTSVALGRTKVLCDRTKEQGEDSPDFFTPETAIGYVLSSQLSTYLKRSCNQLSLFDMPIEEYRELRQRLILSRGIDQGDFRGGAINTVADDPFPGRMVWLKACEATMAQIFAQRLLDALSSPPQERQSRRRRRGSDRSGASQSTRTPEQTSELEQIWNHLSVRIEQIAEHLARSPTRGSFATQRLISQVDGARADFAERLERAASWGSSDTMSGEEKRRRKRLRMNVRSGVLRRVKEMLEATSAYAEAILSQDFSDRLFAALSGEEVADARRALEAARARLNQRRLCDEDVDVILAIMHLMSIGYRGRDGLDPISEFVETDYYSQVFIDEYQDFTEVQLFLMGQTASPRRDAVTLVGDLYQRLSHRHAPDLKDCFPKARSHQVEPKMLFRNLRQPPPFARFSQGIREFILGEPPADPSINAGAGSPPSLILCDSNDNKDVIFDCISETPKSHSVVVICPTDEIARDLEKNLSEGLKEEYRESKLSSHTDLVRSYFVHFTIPLATKGLEFDTVIVSDVGRYNFNDPVEANSFYVACSRARKSLYMTLDRHANRPQLKNLIDRELVKVVIDWDGMGVV